MNRIPAFAAILILFLSPGCQRDPSGEQSPGIREVLVYSRTRGYRHECIEPGIRAMEAFFAPRGFKITATEDSSYFQPGVLAGFDAVMFFQTTGNVLNSQQEKAFEAYIRSGKGFVGVHAASDTEYDWPWYTRLVGAQFDSHPDIQDAVVVRREAAHPSCRHLPDRWKRHDEWYNFRALPTDVDTLLTVDESTYAGGIHGDFHPVAWCHEMDGGRAFYTAMGHTVESYQDTLFLRQILGGLQWVTAR